MKKETYLFDPRPQYPFVITATRYPGSDALDATSLIFTHGTGFHKEQWEPTIEHLYENDGAQNGFKIREVWSIECPNHGDSAVLNEDKLLSGCYDQVFGWEEYARIVHAMLTGLGTLKLLQGSSQSEVKVDFTERKLIGVGHSMGAVALILTQTFHPPIHFESFVLVEPMLIVRIHERLSSGPSNRLGKSAIVRRDVWSSRENAWEVFRSRPSWQIWDQRVLRIYVEHGLRDIPSSDPDGRTGVTLKCTKVQEAACYQDILGRTRAYDFLGHFCSTNQVHIIWGAIHDYVHPSIKEDIENVAAQGKLASVQSVPDVGHLAPQISPVGVANAVWATFVKTTSKSKL